MSVTGNLGTPKGLDDAAQVPATAGIEDGPADGGAQRLPVSVPAARDGAPPASSDDVEEAPLVQAVGAPTTKPADEAGAATGGAAPDDAVSPVVESPVVESSAEESSAEESSAPAPAPAPISAPVPVAVVAAPADVSAGSSTGDDAPAVSTTEDATEARDDDADAGPSLAASPAVLPLPESDPVPAPSVVATPAAPDTAHGRLGKALKPAYSRSQLLAGVLCALLGFALVAQVRHSGQDELASLRQDDLVRLLDDVTGRAEQLDAEVSRLQASRDELATGTDSARAALELAQARATAEGILSGRLPAEGPGVRIVVRDPDNKLRAMDLVNLLEELRNAGTEVAQVNGVRLVASSSFVDVGGRIQVDGTPLESPLEWIVIGDPATIDRAIEIPGGALPRIRAAGATTDDTEQLDTVTVDATVELRDPRFARPADPDDG